MKNADKYMKNNFLPQKEYFDWVKKDAPDRAPAWCSVDLRDGNQALVTPMSLDEKIEFFKLLTALGFKEIEVGFPAAAETEFAFCRRLIEDGLIPPGVTIQVLTQARKHIIEKTFEALSGAKSAIVHVYNSTSVCQREQVFKKTKDEIKKIAVDGAGMLVKYADKTNGNFTFEYSPESFSNTEPEFALDVIEGVLDVFKPVKEKKCIINLPDTVQLSLPHVYASQVEFISKNLSRRDSVILSLHPHNDRGCAIAAAELGLLAGGDRIEGTLFGNGERTGNTDIITVAMNLFMHGVDPGLDFSDLPRIAGAYEKITGMAVNPRQPYSGELVFTAFSGSHQDAIAKGLSYRAENGSKFWSVPYLPIDPADVGRSYDTAVIRINSQSGKGGIGYLLENAFGFVLPAAMREAVGYYVKDASDRAHKELSPKDVLDAFKEGFVNLSSPVGLNDFNSGKNGAQRTAEIFYSLNGKILSSSGAGNGILDAASDAVQKALGLSFSTFGYFEHALQSGTKAEAAAYVGLDADGKKFWAAGVDTDITTATVKALIGAVNKILLSKR
jgi:2-isopropylmalate synthase